MLRDVAPVGAVEGCLLFSGRTHVASIKLDRASSWRWFALPAIDADAWQAGFPDQDTAKSAAYAHWSYWLGERGLEPGSGPERFGQLELKTRGEFSFDICLKGCSLGVMHRYVDIDGASLAKPYGWRLNFAEANVTADYESASSAEEALRAAEAAWIKWMSAAEIRYSA